MSAHESAPRTPAAAAIRRERERERESPLPPRQYSHALRSGCVRLSLSCSRAEVGSGGGGHLQLVDSDCALPHLTSKTWQEGDGKGWHPVESMKIVAEPPPRVYTLKATFRHQSECAGEYELCRGRLAFGKVQQLYCCRDSINHMKLARAA